MNYLFLFITIVFSTVTFAQDIWRFDPKNIQLDCSQYRGNTYEDGTTEQDCRMQNHDNNNNKKKCGLACRLYSPTGRLIASGVLGGMSGIVWDAASREERNIEKNIENLRDIKKQITDSAGTGLSGCSENAFEDESNSECYCFNPDGGLNQSRDKGGVCARFYPGYRKRELNTARNEIKGCVTQAGQFDLNCQCRSKKKGAGSCHKTTSLEFPGLGKGTRTLLSAPFIAGNKENSGNIGGAQGAYANGDSRNIAKLKKKILEKKLGKKKANRVNRAAKLEIGRISRNPAFRKMGQNIANRNAGSNLLSSLPSQVQNNLKKVAPKAVAIADKGYSKARGKSRSNRRRGSEEFKIGNSEEFAIDGIDDLASNKKYDYKDSDISNVSGASIFKVISSRYHRSAFRRLFEEAK